MSEDKEQSFPHGALLAIGTLIGISLLLVMYGKFTGNTESTKLVSDETVIEQNRDLRFVDQEGGVVVVYDATDHSKVHTLAPGTENFIRGVLRGLVRERRSLELGDESPFRLMNIGNGQLVLQDLATNRQINLNAFGQTNASSFAQLLNPSST
jgi:putative photosynthetic complex assembly protein